MFRPKEVVVVIIPCVQISENCFLQILLNYTNILNQPSCNFSFVDFTYFK